MNVINVAKKLHILGVWRRCCLFLVNKVCVGTRPLPNRIKCALLRTLGYRIGVNTMIVGPIYSTGTIEIGNNCWIGKNMTVNGNGHVIIGDNCDIAPEVIFNTGGHKIGDTNRRAGIGETYTIRVGDGSWIGARSTIIRNTTIGKGCVVAACACVVSDVMDHTLVGGVPAKLIRKLRDEDSVYDSQ